MIQFLERAYPSANSVLLEGPRPVLVDTGFGADADELMTALAGATPTLIVNTHFHSDHVGGNHALQRRFAAPIAASTRDAGPEAREAAWLQQTIEAYTVSRLLQPGDVVETGASDWTVIATPGHAPGHISLHCPAAGILVLGDALHQADVGWLSPLRPDSLDATEATLDRLAALPARIGYSGHGPAIDDLPAAFARARRRVEVWRRDPEQAGWHACKRIFAHALMLQDGLAEAALAPTLLTWPWFCDHARLVFRCAPADFVAPLLREMLRADAAYWADGRLLPRAVYRRPATPPRPA